MAGQGLRSVVVNVRKRQIFLYHVKTNINSYNPTAPTEVLPALADISACLYNDQDNGLPLQGHWQVTQKCCLQMNQRVTLMKTRQGKL